MHELSIATSILEIARRQAREAGAARINSVEVAIGRLAGVELEALRFCFAAARGEDQLTVETELVVRDIPGRGHCPTCGAEPELEVPLGTCPECGTPGLEIVAGRELTVRSLNVD
jgi:Zn finger protein HypA/HybF (possibly regulating hydrogenase expression)